METFLDGGLFELAIAIAFAGFLNIIFLKKYLLIVFCLLIVACPLLLFFIDKNELYYWLVSISLFNSILLIVLLWKEKKRNPYQPLFNTGAMRKKMNDTGNKISGFIKRRANTGKNKLES